MNSNPVKSYAISLHQDLQKQLLAICIETESEQVKRLEAAVQACNAYIAELYTFIPKEGFECTETEILFFKIIKPLFAREREYHQRLYHARLFGDETGKFWKNELIRMEKLLTEHQEFVSYYHNGDTYNDHAWFSQGEPPLPTPLCMWPSETNPRQTSARDGWVSGLIAVERYMDWLVAKTNKTENRL